MVGIEDCYEGIDPFNIKYFYVKEGGLFKMQEFSKINNRLKIKDSFTFQNQTYTFAFDRRKIKAHQLMYVTSNKTLEECLIEVKQASLNLRKEILEGIKRKLQFKAKK